jgi:Histidine kinase
VDGVGGQRSGVGAERPGTADAILRSAIDGISDPVYAKDTEGRYLLANPAACAIAGRPERFRQQLATPAGPRVYQALKAPWRDAGGRIAVGLHDGPVQGLATLGFELARARALLAEGKAGPAMAALGECEADVAGEVAAALRRIMHDLRPLLLDQQGLANVADHAHASRVEVRLERSAAGEVVLSVGDDGAGFDPARLGGAGGAVGFGTTVEARVPGPSGAAEGRRS